MSEETSETPQIPLGIPGHTTEADIERAAPRVAQQASASEKDVPKRSYFVDDKSSYADRVVLEDGTWFELVPLEDDEIKYYNATTKRWCEAIGWTPEMLQNATLLERGITSEQLGLKAGDLRALILSSEQEDAKAAIINEARTRVVVAGVSSWSLAPRCDDKRKTKLHKDIIRLICDRIVAFSVYGLSEARFRAAGDSPATSG